jgi:formylglycine-generating enzyme required for sulfatase activity
VLISSGISNAFRKGHAFRALMALCALTFSGVSFGQETPDHFRERDLQFIPVEPGEFTMGSPATEKGRFDNEVPHLVKITKPFEIGATEVTQALWKRVMGKLPKFVAARNDDLPITYVSWNEAQRFIARLNRLRKGNGYRYRLPTEAEWEYAARGAQKYSPKERQLAYSFGDSQASLDEYAWSWNNAKLGPQPVATRKPSPLGLFDIHGNVWEWTLDRYTEDASKIAVDPKYGHPVLVKDGDRRVLRGGCTNYNGRTMRSAFRGRLDPAAGHGNIGLRLVRVLK